jgi:hypothetical protein
MAYIGHEPGRATLKYRRPAKHEAWDCPMSSICNAGKSYGKTVRVDRAIDLRQFTRGGMRTTRRFRIQTAGSPPPVPTRGCLTVRTGQFACR